MTCVVHSGTSGEQCPVPVFVRTKEGPEAVTQAEGGAGLRANPRSLHFLLLPSLPDLWPPVLRCWGWERGNACIQRPAGGRPGRGHLGPWECRQT